VEHLRKRQISLKKANFPEKFLGKFVDLVVKIAFSGKFGVCANAPVYL
jgi:hypothetical protein